MTFATIEEFDSALKDILTFINLHNFDFYTFVKNIYSSELLEDLLEYASNNNLVIGVTIQGINVETARLNFTLDETVCLTSNGLYFIETH